MENEALQRALSDLTYDQAMASVQHGATATRQAGGVAVFWFHGLVVRGDHSAFIPTQADRKASDWRLVVQAGKQ